MPPSAQRVSRLYVVGLPSGGLLLGIATHRFLKSLQELVGFMLAILLPSTQRNHCSQHVGRGEDFVSSMGSHVSQRCYSR
jgi:hypothetical protein